MPDLFPALNVSIENHKSIWSEVFHYHFLLHSVIPVLLCWIWKAAFPYFILYSPGIYSQGRYVNDWTESMWCALCNKSRKKHLAFNWTNNILMLQKWHLHVRATIIVYTRYSLFIVHFENGLFKLCNAVSAACVFIAFFIQKYNFAWRIYCIL